MLPFIIIESGFVAQHGDDFLLANNAQWIGFSMEIGPEGAVYVLDWHDGDICGKEVLDKETGRIFRITPENSLAENWEGRYSDLASLSDEQLAELQLSKSAWHARRARVILQNRATKTEINDQALKKLQEIFRSHSNQDWRLRAMWALHVIGKLPVAGLTESLSDKDQYIRAWAIQLLCEERNASKETLSKFANMAGQDPSPVVRLYLSAALQRIDPDDRWDIATGLTGHQEDANDHNIPKMIWFGIEPLVERDPGRALELAGNCQIPLITESIARRAVDANALEAIVAAIGKLPNAKLGLLEGMRTCLEGRTDVAAPSNWTGLYKKLPSREKVAPVALAVAQQFGDSEAAKQYLVTLKDKNVPVEKRRQALNGLADQQWPDLVQQLEILLDEPSLRTDAIRTIAAFDNNQLGKALLKRYPNFSDADKLETVQTMASRSQYGWMITQALQNGEIPKRDVPAYVARQLRRVVGNGFVEVWGPIDQLSSDEEAAFAKYKALLTDEALSSSDAANGRSVFQRSCSACHKMYGEGGTLGPDITGSNRQNIDYLLSNILDPSGEIQDDYKMVVVTTRDGRTYTGNVATETDRQLTLRIVGQDVILTKSDIQSQETTPNSMMPKGLLETLTDEEVLDLVAYLRSDRQVEPASD